MDYVQHVQGDLVKVKLKMANYVGPVIIIIAIIIIIKIIIIIIFVIISL